MIAQVIEFLPPTANTWIDFLTLVFATCPLPFPSCCGHLGSELTDGNLLSFSPSIISNEQEKNFIAKAYYKNCMDFKILM